MIDGGAPCDAGVLSFKAGPRRSCSRPMTTRYSSRALGASAPPMARRKKKQKLVAARMFACVLYISMHKSKEHHLDMMVL